jgi:hypothetical protein
VGFLNRAEPATLPETPLADHVPSPKEPDAVGRGLVHDAYGKAIMRRAAGDAFLDGGAVYGMRLGDDAASGRIDGVVGNRIAEGESRVPNQIRARFGPYLPSLSLQAPAHHCRSSK